MKIEKIGNVRFYPSTHAPDPGTADVSFSTDCETNNFLLIIDLETQDEECAIDRGRRITRLWQLTEGMVADDQLAAIFHHAELKNAWLDLKIELGRVMLQILDALAAGVENFMGRGRAPGPSLQGGPVSPTPTQEDKQSKGQ